MINQELLEFDLTAQIELVKKGEVTAYDIVLSQLNLIAKQNPSLNAFISVADEKSFNSNQLAALVDTPLAGLSVAVKDNIDVLGFVTTAGMETRVGRKPNSDAFVAEKLRQAGASFIGKVNMHEGALGATNQNHFFGNCYNPHKLGYTPGGSSGGSACAVAAGLASISLGTDTMGSVRIPASYCGIFGLKPSRGAVSNRGSVACSRLMDNIGPMARSARDLTLAFNLMNQVDRSNADSVGSPSCLSLPKPQDTIILVPDNLTDLGIADDIIADFERNLQVFIDLGYQFENFNFSNYDFAAARRAGLLICEAEMRVEHAQDWQSNREKFSPYMQSMLGFIDTRTPMDIIQSERVLDNAAVFANSLFERGQVLLMPTAPQRAFSFEKTTPANQADLTSFANQAGLAAVSIPMLTNNSLPTGMQLVGPNGSDHLLLSLAEKWQREAGFNYQLP